MKSKAVAVLLMLTMFTVACTVDQVLQDIDLVLQTATSISVAVGAVSPADAAAIQVISGIGIAGMNSIQQWYDAYKKTGAASDLAKLQAAMAATQQTLPSALASAHISDPTAVAKVTAWVNLVMTTVNVVANAVGQANAPVSARKMAEAVPSPASIKARWNTEVCQGDAACGKLVKVRRLK